MRKIDHELQEAILAKRPFSKENTVLFRDGDSGKWALLLHGNKIASFVEEHRNLIPTAISLAGYPTKTTCARLNAIPGVNVHIKDHTPYLHNSEIDAESWWPLTNGVRKFAADKMRELRK